MRRMIVVAVLMLSAISHAAIIGTNLGTAAPPSVLGGWIMQPFEDDARPTSATYSNVPSPFGGQVGFSVSLLHLRTTAAIWGHGYAKDVYQRTPSGNVTLTFPANTRAFLLYCRQNSLVSASFTVTANDGTALTQTVPAGTPANGFGFHTTGTTVLTSITVNAGTGYLIGEFRIGDTQVGPLPTNYKGITLTGAPGVTTRVDQRGSELWAGEVQYGQPFGVSLRPGPVHGIETKLRMLRAASLPTPDPYVRFESYGRIGAGNEQLLTKLNIREAGTNVELLPSFDGFASSSLVVRAYRTGTLVNERTYPTGAIIARIPTSAVIVWKVIPIGVRPRCWVDGPGCWDPMMRIELAGDTLVELLGGGGPSLVDTLEILEGNPSSQPNVFATRVDVFGQHAGFRIQDALIDAFDQRARGAGAARISGILQGGLNPVPPFALSGITTSPGGLTVDLSSDLRFGRSGGLASGFDREIDPCGTPWRRIPWPPVPPPQGPLWMQFDTLATLSDGSERVIGASRIDYIGSQLQLKSLYGGIGSSQTQIVLGLGGSAVASAIGPDGQPIAICPEWPVQWWRRGPRIPWMWRWPRCWWCPPWPCLSCPPFPLPIDPDVFEDRWVFEGPRPIFVPSLGRTVQADEILLRPTAMALPVRSFKQLQMTAQGFGSLDVGPFTPTPYCAGQKRGDSNCDNRVDFNDIAGFTAALVGEEVWVQSTGSNCGYLCVNDVDGDNRVNFDDIGAFVNCLVVACD